MDILIHIAIILHNFNCHEITPLEEVKLQLGMMENVIDIPVAADLYFVLGFHYHTPGKLDKEKYAMRKYFRELKPS